MLFANFFEIESFVFSKHAVFSDVHLKAVMSVSHFIFSPPRFFTYQGRWVGLKNPLLELRPTRPIPGGINPRHSEGDMPCCYLGVPYLVNG